MARRTKVQREHAQMVEAAVVKSIYKGIEESAGDWRRDHLGASIIGHRCDRYLWLSFRWALNPEHDGRQLRLFKRGDREEPALVADLENAGVTVEQADPETGEQYRVRWGHVGGSADGIAYGLPDGVDGQELHLLEFKTANGKSFEYLKKKKVRSAKKEHWIQMQVYMSGLGLKHALYIVVRKDTDEIYVELVDYDEGIAQAAVDRGQIIVHMPGPPDRMDPEEVPCVYKSKDGTRWPCDFFDLCHGKQMPERNCRTCVDSTPVTDTRDGPVWNCKLHNKRLTSEEQRAGCDLQCSIPPIVNADVASVVDREITYQFDDGETVTEGATL